MKLNRLFKLDYSMLSSYLGRWSTVLVFTLIILIAAGALLLEEDDIAHMPVGIGVYDLDSAAVHRSLEDLARFVRGKGGGDIRWTYLREGDDPEGCDFYLMRTLRFVPYLAHDLLDCSLIVTVTEGRKYAKGAVIKGEGRADGAGATGVVFTSPYSASGFLSPYLALVSSGMDLSPATTNIDFAGSEDRVIYGVVFGAYRYGGIGLERLRYLEKRGLVRKGEIEIVIEGGSYPELVLASDHGGDIRRFDRFTRRFLLLVERMPPALKTDLENIGVSGFTEPRQEDMDVMGSLSGIVPEWARREGGRAQGDR